MDIKEIQEHLLEDEEVNEETLAEVSDGKGDDE